MLNVPVKQSEVEGGIHHICNYTPDVLWICGLPFGVIHKPSILLLMYSYHRVTLK